MFKTLNELPADSQERIGASPAVAERLYIKNVFHRRTASSVNGLVTAFNLIIGLVVYLIATKGKGEGSRH
jgi:hypothetical protein